MKILRLADRLAGWWIDWRIDRHIKKRPELHDFEMISLDIKRGRKQGNIELLVATSAISILADHAATMLAENNAKNYVQFDMMPRVDRGLRPIRVTVQWAGGLSPAKKVAQLEQAVLTAVNLYPDLESLFSGMVTELTGDDGV